MEEKTNINKETKKTIKEVQKYCYLKENNLNNLNDKLKNKDYKLILIYNYEIKSLYMKYIYLITDHLKNFLKKEVFKTNLSTDYQKNNFKWDKFFESPKKVFKNYKNKLNTYYKYTKNIDIKKLFNSFCLGEVVEFINYLNTSKKNIILDHYKIETFDIFKLFFTSIYNLKKLLTKTVFILNLNLDILINKEWENFVIKQNKNFTTFNYISKIIDNLNNICSVNSPASFEIEEKFIFNSLFKK